MSTTATSKMPTVKGEINFDPSRDIQSMEGKVVLITGANTGLGKQTALELAKHQPAHIWMAARSAVKGEAAVAEVKAHSPGVSASFLELDLASLESVKNAAERVSFSSERLDLLLLNAGIMGHPPALTRDGYEIHFGTNHLGHALLFKLLVPLLMKTGADVRVVSLTSWGYKFCKEPGIPFEQLRNAMVEGLGPVQRYTQSKTANLLYAKEAAKRYPQFTTVSVDPGNVMTELFGREHGDDYMRHLATVVAPQAALTVEEGAKNQLWAATSHKVTTGTYYEPIGVVAEEVGYALDDELAKKLWDWTEKELSSYKL